MKSLRRHKLKLPTLACWPQKCPERDDTWYMFELQLKPDQTLEWYLRRPSHLGPITYHSAAEAIEEARASNRQLLQIVENLKLTPEIEVSLRLKVEKLLTAEERLMNEERLMLTEAMKRNSEISRPNPDDITLPTDLESLRDELQKILYRFPYIHYARINRFGITLAKSGDNNWSHRLPHNKKTAIHCDREKIARGFGLDGRDHWGKTKAAIRTIMLPRANQLLQQTGFKMMLDEALLRGQKIVVCEGFVFWYEDDDSVGWTVKQVSDISEKKGISIWKEGTILSKNHGRIVVLPYVKENGEFIQGHTKNAPHDGKAPLRHANHHVELPFEVLDGDLMYDLFGKMKYE